MTTVSLPVSSNGSEIYIPLSRRTADLPAPVLGEPCPDPALHRVEKIGEGALLHHAAWLLPMLGMLIVGGIGIDRPGLWADELATWGMTTVSWHETWRQLAGTDATIGPYYLLIRMWTAVFGDSDLALRLPSLLAMAGAAAIVARIGTRVHSAKAGLVAGAILIVLPISTRFAQEARPYALVVLAAALATLIVVRMLDETTFWTALGYVLAIAAMGAFHLVALLTLAAHGFAVMIIRPKLLWRWVPVAVIGVLPIAWLVLTGQQQSKQIDWIPLARTAAINAYADEFFGNALIGGAVIALGLAGLSRARGNLVAGALAIIPTVMLFAAGTMVHIWQNRYLLFTLIGWALLAGFILARRGWVTALAAVAVLATLGIPGQAALRAPAGRYQDTKAIVALLAQEVRDGDGIIYGATDRGPGALNRDILAHYLPAGKQPRDLLMIRPMRTDGWMLAGEDPDVASRVDGVNRIWVLRLGDYEDPVSELDGAKSEVLRERYVVIQTWHTTGLTLGLLQRGAR